MEDASGGGLLRQHDPLESFPGGLDKGEKGRIINGGLGGRQPVMHDCLQNVPRRDVACPEWADVNNWPAEELRLAVGAGK